MRRWGFRVGAVGVGLLAVLLLEGLLRILPGELPDRQTWNERRNLLSVDAYYRHYDRFFVEVGERDGVPVCGPDPERCRGTFSRANGMQWDRFPCEKPPGTLRIVTLGGSSTQGFGVDASQTFATRLEEILRRETSREVEVINAGIAGYNTVQIRRMMPHLWSLEPDLLILYAGHNDYNYFLVANAAELIPRWLRRLRRAGDRWYLWRGLREIYYRFRPPRGLANPPRVGWGRPGGARQRPPQWRDEPRPVPETRAGRRQLVEQERKAREVLEKRFRENVEAIARQARDRGAELLLLTPVCRIHDPPVDSIHWRDLDAAALQAWETAWNALTDEGAPQGGPRAEPHLERALALDPTYSHLRFLAGRSLRQQGRPQAARPHFLAAMDYNPPTAMDRAPPRHADLVVQTARSSGLPVHDLWPVFAAEAQEPGYPGEDLFLDTIHPNPEGHRLIAREAARFLLEQTARFSRDGTLEEE